MPIDSRTAGDVATRHGLTLGDAAALARLCDTRDEAEELAAKFAPPAPEPAATTSLEASLRNKLGMPE